MCDQVNQAKRWYQWGEGYSSVVIAKGKREIKIDAAAWGNCGRY